MSKPRHARQVRLAEIGEDGQARICATTVRIDADGLGGTIEARYLAGAGVKAIATGSSVVAEAAKAVDPAVQIVPAPGDRGAADVPPVFGARDPVALEVAIGAWRALAQVRRAAFGRQGET